MGIPDVTDVGKSWKWIPEEAYWEWQPHYLPIGGRLAVDISEYEKCDRCDRQAMIMLPVDRRFCREHFEQEGEKK